MSFLAGKDTSVLFGAFDLSSYFNSSSFSRDQAVNETTTFGSDQATYISSLETANVTLGGFFDGELIRLMKSFKLLSDQQQQLP